MSISNEEFSEIMISLGDDVNDLCDELYEALEDGISKDDGKILLTRAEKQVNEFKNLLERVGEGKKKEVMNYNSDIEFIAEHAEKLRKKLEK